MTRRLPALAFAAALAAPVALAACGSDNEPGDPASQTTTAPAPEPSPVQTTRSTTDDGGAGGSTATATDTATDTATGGTGDNQGTVDVPDAYAGVLAAIPLAELEAGGMAFELDDGDGDVWEVHVAVGDDDIEVRIDGTGTEVLSSEREADLGSDDAAGLDAAGVSLVEAVRIAIGEHGGDAPVDDAGISREDDGGYAWEVAFTDDIEVYLSVVDGSVLRVES